VWPGWGSHASEKPALSEALNSNGIKFVGHTFPVTSVLGDKIIAANILAQDCQGALHSVKWIFWR
jgi:biotin carboxylase